MNKVILTGNLTRDPDEKQTPTGTHACSFSVAVKRPYANSDGEYTTDFFNCTAWRGLADNIVKYCRKGSKVLVTGAIQNRTYEDNKGVNRTVTEVIADGVEFLSSNKREEEDDYEPRERSAPNISAPKKKPQLSVFDDDGDIPF